MVTAIRAAYVWDGTGDNPIANGIVLIEGGIITVVGSASDTEIPQNTELID
jgi:imidazolonepropionase-like amidohydrolase